MSDDIHNLEPDYGTGKKNLRIYFVGFLLCVLLTLIPFGLVEQHLTQLSSKVALTLSHSSLLLVLFLAALIQFIVQVVCFLRLSSGTEQGKTNILSFVFSIVVLVVIIAGSVWIMYHLNYNMMH